MANQKVKQKPNLFVISKVKQVVDKEAERVKKVKTTNLVTSERFRTR
jgi:hypothetical protein